MIGDILALWPGAKIIAMSGGARLDNIDGEQLGICDTVEKPVYPATLLDSVRRCLGTTSEAPQ
jgi:DNA-binding NtrC family response regulator